MTVLSVVRVVQTREPKAVEAMVLEFVVTGDGKQRNRATRLCYQSRLFKTDCFDPRALCFGTIVCNAMEDCTLEF